MTEDTSVIKPRSSWHLWVVGILSLFWNAFGCFDYTMTVTRNEGYLEPYPKEVLDYWFAMPWWMFALWAIGVFGGLLGAIALLMRSSWAVKLFAVSLIAATINMAISLTDADAPKMEGAEFMSILIILLATLQLVYAWWQSRRGVLR